MAIKLLMPALSPTMEEGKLAVWHKKKGDKIAAGDLIAEIETDKAVMEYEATDEGILAKILIQPGTSHVKVNTPIAIMAEEGEDIENLSIEESVHPAEQSSAPLSAPIAPFSAQPISSERQLSEPSVEGANMRLITVREALNEAIAEEMRRDEDVFLMGEEVAEYQGAYKVSQGLLEEFGSRRVIDTPITEMGFAGIGVGSAFAGLRPVIEFMTFNFAMQAIDQIINSAAKTYYMSGGQISVPIVFRGPNGAASRVAAQHSQCYAAWYSNVPGLKVVMPYTAADAKGLLKAAIRDPNPVVFLENELLYGAKFEVPDIEDYVIPLGKARLHRAGSDVTIVSFGIGMKYVDEALPILDSENISAEVIDLRTIKPLDIEPILESVRKTGRLVVIEEGFPQSSVGDHIANIVTKEAFDYLDAPVHTIAGKDVPMPYAANLEKMALPSVDELLAAVKSVLYKN